MASTIDVSFIKQYQEEVHALFDVVGNKLLDNTWAHRNVVGSTYDVPLIGKIVANTKARNADVVALDPEVSKATITLADYYAPVYVDKLDELKTNANIREGFQKQTVAAIGRRVDQTIITALNASTNTIATTAGGLTYAKLLEALTKLNSVDVPDEDRVLVLGAKQISDALGIQQLTSSDYANVNAIMQAGIGQALGFTWVRSNLLPVATNVRTGFAYSKQAIVSAIGQDITTEVNYVPEKVAHLFNTFVSLGAGIIDPTGVVKLSFSEA